MSAPVVKQFNPFIFYTATAATLGISAASVETRFFTRVCLWIAAGVVSWNLLEYVLHRFAFHHQTPATNSQGSHSFLSAAHQEHHEHPHSVERLFASLTLSAPVALCYYLLAWLLSGDWRAAAYLFVGLVIGYFCYEWLHYQAHHGAPRLRLFKYLRKYHLLHHHRTPDLRFGVTSPAIDYLFGTFLPVGGRKPTANERGGAQMRASRIH